MSQDTLDNAFRKNGFAEAVQNDIRRGVTFGQGAGLSFERLVKDLSNEHSLDEVDNYDALFGVYFIYMTMATPMARCQVLTDMSDFGLENTQFKIAMAFEEAAREVELQLLGTARTYVGIMK